MDIVRLGIIGIGNIGTAHAHAVYGGEISGMKLKAVCDVNPKRLEYAKAAFDGVKGFQAPTSLSKAEHATP